MAFSFVQVKDMYLRKILATLLITAAASSVWAGPQLKLLEEGFNFGQFVAHGKLTHAFIIQSVGTDTLRINQVVPGCGCTKAPLLDSVLAPGESTRIEITLSTKGFRGNVSKRPYFTTNIGLEYNYLKLDAYVLAEDQKTTPVTLEPLRVDVSQFNKLRRKATFKLTNTSQQEYSLIVADSAFKSFDVKLPKRIKAGETIEGELLVKQDAIEKDFEESITIEIGDELRTRLSVAVVRVYRPSSGS